MRESTLSYVVLSNPRLVKGHSLVIPKRHIEEPWELSSDELLDIFKQIDWVREKLLASLAEGVDIRQHYRPFLPQGRIKVDHLHFHVLPRILNDDIFQVSMQHETKLFTDLTPDERDEVVQLLE